MLKSKKKACAGCKALRKNADGYVCALGVNIEFSLIEVGTTAAPSKPTPADKCLKPRTPEDYAEAKKLFKKAKQRAEKRAVREAFSRLKNK